MLQISIEENNSEGAIELQECPEWISHAPCTALIYQSFRIFKLISFFYERNYKRQFLYYIAKHFYSLLESGLNSILKY